MSHPADWYRASAGHYWRGLNEQIMYRNREWAARIGRSAPGGYYRRMSVAGQVVKGPYKTFKAAVKAAPSRRM